MNLTALTGNLGSDPESIFTSEGTHIAKFSLAFDSGKKDKTNWIQVSAFKKLADAVAKYLHKGARVAVVATLDQNRWEDDQGQSRSNHQLIARNIDFIKTDGRGFDNNDGQSPDYGDDDIPF
jgi:single-strand DNA-binding protein